MQDKIETLQDLRDCNAAVAHMTDQIAEMAYQSDGEETPEIAAVDAAMGATKHMILTDGIDMLGRLRVEREDRIKMLKAEKADTDRKIKAVQRSIDFLNYLISESMRVTGVKKAKGNHYSFTAYVSEHTSVDMDELNDRWKGIAEQGAREMGLPGYIDIELKTSVTKIQDWAPTHDGQGIAFLQTETADAVRFTKPRKAKED